MKSNINQKMLCFTIGIVLLIISNMMASSEASTRMLIFDKTRVVLQNQVRNSNALIHCWSSEDDLGLQELAYNATFSWHFRVNFSLSTKFVCDIKTKIGSGKYTVYDEYAGQVSGKYCFWAITKDRGPCMLVKGQPQDKFCQGWQHPNSIADAPNY
ncbi:hypothetical protein CASFOL_006734 [Castilleja foliolosa]|uniref:S-protein homolog n=1 Tax=Castilleja foliolosa TaxID=1961234 RepID=A0ABD3E7A0_9LAMI